MSKKLYFCAKKDFNVDGWGAPSPEGVSMEIGLQLKLQGYSELPQPYRTCWEGGAIAVEIFDEERIPEGSVISWLDKIGYENLKLSKKV